MTKTHYDIGTYKSDGTPKNKRDKKGRFKEKGGFIKNVISVFTTIKNIIKFTFKWATIGGLFGGVVYLAFLFGTLARTEVIKADPIDTMAQKVEKMKDALIDEIIKKETGTSTAPCIPDDNKRGTLPIKDKVSCGVLKFKVGTVQYYEKNLYGKNLDNYEAMAIALDETKARALARDIIFKVPGGIRNWSVATNDMVSKTELIKILEK